MVPEYVILQPAAFTSVSYIFVYTFAIYVPLLVP